MRVMVQCLAVGLCMLASIAQGQQNPDGQLPLGNYGNPLLLLLRDEAVFRELKVTAAQRTELQSLAERVDALIWPARNKSQEASQAAWKSATELAQQDAGRILNGNQQRRIEEIILWIQGSQALGRQDVADHLKLTEKQRESIQEVLTTTSQNLAKLMQEARAGAAPQPLEDQARDLRKSELRRINQLLNETQRKQWVKLAGEKVDLAALGRVSFTAPPLIAERNDWLKPEQAVDSISGRVAVVHFFANGCINCQRNYPHYLKWQSTFRERDLLIVGIHTPETSAERDVERLQQKVAAAGFEFPILVDNDLKNWNAWGNSMWPSVYLVDRRGQIRYWWFGELIWQGTDGEAKMRQRIEELLDESPPKKPEQSR